MRLMFFFLCLFSSMIGVSQPLIPKELEGKWILEKAVLEESPLGKPDKISQVVLLPKQTNSHFMFKHCIIELDLQNESETTPAKSALIIYPNKEIKNPKVNISGNVISFLEFSPISKSEIEPFDTPFTYTYRLESEKSLILSTRETFYNNRLQIPLKGQLHIHLTRVSQ